MFHKVIGDEEISHWITSSATCPEKSLITCSAWSHLCYQGPRQNLPL